MYTLATRRTIASPSSPFSFKLFGTEPCLKISSSIPPPKHPFPPLTLSGLVYTDYRTTNARRRRLLCVPEECVWPGLIGPGFVARKRGTFPLIPAWNTSVQCKPTTLEAQNKPTPRARALLLHYTHQLPLSLSLGERRDQKLPPISERQGRGSLPFRPRPAMKANSLLKEHNLQEGRRRRTKRKEKNLK